MNKFILRILIILGITDKRNWCLITLIEYKQVSKQKQIYFSKK
jgi:hypothetical protein